MSGGLDRDRPGSVGFPSGPALQGVARSALHTINSEKPRSSFPVGMAAKLFSMALRFVLTAVSARLVARSWACGEPPFAALTLSPGPDGAFQRKTPTETEFLSRKSVLRFFACTLLMEVVR